MGHTGPVDCPHREDDPAWFSSRSLLTLFIPWLGLQRAQKDGVNSLEMFRQLFTAFAAALFLIGLVVLFLAPGGPGDAAMSAGVVAIGVAGYGVISLFIPRLFERPLDCADPQALLASYRTRFFLRIAFADAAALVGFVGFFLSDAWWLYPLGGVFATIGFARLAPTRRNLERDEEALHLTGCGESLLHVLTSSSS